MNAPWFTPAFAPVPGIAIGIAGGAFGCIAGMVMSSPERRARWLGIFALTGRSLLACSIAILVAALAAVSLGQPNTVWRALLIPGIAGTAAFAAALPAIAACVRASGPSPSPGRAVHGVPSPSGRDLGPR
jgi:hypothetical protein